MNIATQGGVKRALREKMIPYGNRYALGGSSVVVSSYSCTHPGQTFTDQELEKYYNRVVTLIDALQENPKRTIGFHRPLKIPQQEKLPKVLYKFVRRDVYDKIRCGSLQLGSVQYYRQIEGMGVRDPWEGFAFVNFTGGNEELFISALSGLEHAIFCMTAHSTSNIKMQDQFGEVLLEISDVPELVATITRLIGARASVGRPVLYSDGKYVRYRRALPAFDVNCLLLNVELTEYVFDVLKAAAFYPSVFVKPSSYSEQLEFRVAFDVGRDVPDFIRVEHPSLATFFRAV